MGRSLLYGGKAAECIDVVNQSTLEAALKGNVSQPKEELFFFTRWVFQLWATCQRTGLRRRPT